MSAFLLAGCATASGTAAPTAEPTSTAAPSMITPTPTLTASPTPTPTEDPADPSTWLITEEGIGPITVNAPFSDGVARLPTAVERDPEICRHSVWWKDANGDQLVVVRDPSTDDAGPLELVFWADWVEPYAVGGPRTAAGIGVGSTVDEVRAAYPEATETTQQSAPDIHYIVVDSMFFYYREPSPVISSVWVTNAEQPPYEICG
ncbi:hypothetical protein [Microbacterium sp.]|uniref:hypothetical protein n=1 Tax=Microbacterium sp. TaxID=51671 RepID=UPI002E2FD0E2|nr:hypothetical protein [Microbacterium sp.]HEX5730704.1 hypothetical protein [Microbacterium sp.]